MTNVLSVILLLVLAGCATIDQRGPDGGLPLLSILQLYALHGYQFRLSHLTGRPDLSPGRWVEPGEWLGKVQEAPPKLSEKHHETILRAESQYAGKKYAETRRLIEPVYNEEPYNRFVLELYARTLFWLNERSQSFKIYLELMRSLDAEVPKDTVNVDLWFIDAYWKLGILYLDFGEYSKAAFEISRFLHGGFMTGFVRNPAALEMALGYLTEAYFHLKNREVARYYADQTLKYFPRNQYVLRYLKNIPASQ
ncbi:MAG: hypothetical protein HY694_08930 [Deltaproteobacteria bacterium]|nr:hypothetical protein [Deltaproteobacteria bacterium]